MAGAESQAGFYYQNIVAAGYALDLVVFGSRLLSITLENPERARHIDDIIAEYVDQTAYVQVKWSQDDSSAFTLHNLVTTEDDALPLLAKLARGFRDIDHGSGWKEIVLLSTRRPGTNRQPAKGYDRSLTEFLSDFHAPYIARPAIAHLRDAEKYNEYRQILDRLLSASGLSDLDELSRFLKCLRFRLAQPDCETESERVRLRLAHFGIEETQFGTLLDEVVKWSITCQTVRRDDVLRALGLLDRFIDRLSHRFPVDRQFWVPTPGLFAALDTSIKSLQNGFLLLEGEPGIGKSTALSEYLASRSDVRFGYYCFVPGERALGNERLGDEAFVHSICIGLRNAFPGIDFPRPYAPPSLRLMNEWLIYLSSQGQRVVFVVDGVDHVDCKARQSLVAHPLTSVLDGELPPNVIIVLSSRYHEALSSRLQEHIRSDPRRRIQIPVFGREQVHCFFELRGVVLGDGILDAVVRVSGGVPIYLEYLAEVFQNLNDFEQKRYLDTAPVLRDQKIDVYHQHLWENCRGDEKLAYLLAIVSLRDEFTTPETLRELLRTLGTSATLAWVHEAIKRLQHVLRISDAKSVAIRHSSLSDFVLEKTAHLRAEINHALSSWYAEHPETDDAWRHRFRHLYELGNYRDVLKACDDEWLTRAWAAHRPVLEIHRSLHIAWSAATAERDLIEFIRIALLKQRLALTAHNLELREVSMTRFLLDIGRSDEAMRQVWDGERCVCTPIAFAEFCLHHIGMTGRVPPKHIIKAGLGDGPGRVSSEATLTWYKARSYLSNPSELMIDIADIRWTKNESHRHVRKPVREDESQRLALQLQLAVVRELAGFGNLVALERIRDCEELPETVRVSGRAAAGLALVKAGEKEIGLAEIEACDFSALPEEWRSWLTLELAVHGTEIRRPNGFSSPPQLPTSLLDSQGNGPNEEVLILYGRLRAFFLLDDAGYPWLEAASTGLVEPTRTLVHAIGRLARCWVSGVRHAHSANWLRTELEQVARALDPPPQLFGVMGGSGDLARHRYRSMAHQLFDELWSCATDYLESDHQESLARWWVRDDDGGRALRNPEATRSLAVAIHSRLHARGDAVVREVLKGAERDARTDEETSVIVSELLECAAAWGRCGFRDEAQRIWCELLDIGCGLHWRKDYQLSEILPVLRLAHEQDPGSTIERVSEQLSLAHQLKGVARFRTIAITTQELIEFVAEFDPVLSLRMIEREEDLIYRTGALHGVALTLMKLGTVDTRLILALVATMDRWDNLNAFDEYTNPAMFAVFSEALTRGELETARRSYDLARHLLLVEKEMPAELGRWAAAWAQIGVAPTDVLEDLSLFGSIRGKTAGAHPSSMERSDDELAWDSELGGLTVTSPDELERLLDRLISEAVRRDRTRELDRAREHWSTAIRAGIRHDWSEADEQVLSRCFDVFAEAALAISSEATAREAAHGAVQGLLGALSLGFGTSLDRAVLEELLDVDGWVLEFVRSGGTPYALERRIGEHLTRWIAGAPFHQADQWLDLCQRRFHWDTRATGLVAIAERIASTASDRAVEHLIEAWKCTSETFHGDVNLSRQICSRLLELDRERGRELLFDSFSVQYRQYPDTLIYKLGNLLDYVSVFPGFDAVRLYNVWEGYNRCLAAGLSWKPVDLSWLARSVTGDFEIACLRYLLGLFDYPEVDVRQLALEELFRLVQERPHLTDSILKLWGSLGDGQKEHVATLFYSLALALPESATLWGFRLADLARTEEHYNLRATISETIEFLASRRIAIDMETLEGARALKRQPSIVLARQRPFVPGPRIDVRYPPYRVQSRRCQRLCGL
jgi:hypothetical protein